MDKKPLCPLGDLLKNKKEESDVNTIRFGPIYGDSVNIPFKKKRENSKQLGFFFADKAL